MFDSRRSELMSRVRQRDTRIEQLVRSYLFRCGLRFRKNDTRLPGSPDVVLPKYRAAVFVHGCFWHGHRECKKARLPSTRTEFWRTKIEANRRRDTKFVQELQNRGWTVFVVWGCELSTKDKAADRLRRLVIEIIKLERETKETF